MQIEIYRIVYNGLEKPTFSPYLFREEEKWYVSDAEVAKMLNVELHTRYTFTSVADTERFLSQQSGATIRLQRGG